MAAFWQSALNDGLTVAVDLLGDFLPVIAFGFGVAVLGALASIFIKKG
jgi:hypothetical protein